MSGAGQVVRLLGVLAASMFSPLQSVHCSGTCGSAARDSVAHACQY